MSLATRAVESQAKAVSLATRAVESQAKAVSYLAERLDLRPVPHHRDLVARVDHLLHRKVDNAAVVVAIVVVAAGRPAGGAGAAGDGRVVRLLFEQGLQGKARSKPRRRWDCEAKAVPYLDLAEQLVAF